MSVFLTPDLEPISGGTYFPPRDSFGRLGFSSILTMISDKWKINHSQIVIQGREIAESIRNSIQPLTTKDGEKSTSPNVNNTFDLCFEWFSKRFDTIYGGFGSAPKFPKAGYYLYPFKLINL